MEFVVFSFHFTSFYILVLHILFLHFVLFGFTFSYFFYLNQGCYTYWRDLHSIRMVVISRFFCFNQNCLLNIGDIHTVKDGDILTFLFILIRPVIQIKERFIKNGGILKFLFILIKLQSQQFFIFLFKLSKHNIYLTVKFTKKIHPPPFFLVYINDQQYSRIKQMNKYNIDFFYMHLFTMRCQCVLNWSSNQDAHYSCPR